MLTEFSFSQQEESLQDKLVVDVRRSYETYAKPLREHHQKEFERFKKKFNLSSYAQQIAQVLDAETEVSRFYAELVPVEIAPEEFWARLFFRLKLVTRSGSANFEDELEDEEELGWEDEEPSPAEQPPTPTAGTGDAAVWEEAIKQRDQRIAELEEESDKLRAKVAYLLQRVTELEMQQQEQRPEPQHKERDVSAPSLPPKEALASAASRAADTLSASSESSNSIVLVGHDEPTHTAPPSKPAPPAQSTIKPEAAPAAVAFLASLDDEDGEDGWN